MFQAQRRESVDKEDIYTTIEEVGQMSAPLPYEISLCVLFSQRMYANVPDSSTLDFFEERPSYWRPACTSDELYSQLAQNKYREILQTNIR